MFTRASIRRGIKLSARSRSEQLIKTFDRAPQIRSLVAIMLPDGPSRNESPVSTDFSTPITYNRFNAQFCVSAKIFRDTVENNAHHMHIWPDGTRESMILCSSFKHVIGWYCLRKNVAVFQWPIVACSAENVMLEGNSVVDKTDATTRLDIYNWHSDIGDKERYLKLADQSVAHFGKIKVSYGDLIAYKEYRIKEQRQVMMGVSDWIVVAHKIPVHFLFLCVENETVVLRINHPSGPELEELHIGKFLKDYSLSRYLGPFNHAPNLRCNNIPLSMALTLAIVSKAVIKFRRLHLKAQERKFAPGGIGFKRALESETAQFMNKRALY